MNRNFWDAVKAFLRGKFIALNSYIRKESINLDFYFRKQEQIIFRCRRKELIRASINETEIRKSIEKINKTKI